MAYQLGQQIEMLSKYSNVDLLYGPYQDKKAACDNIPENTRDFGRTVLILENKEYKEYWWKDDLTDDGLIVKTTSNESSTESIQSDWNETNETSPTYIKNKPKIPNEFNIKERSTILLTGGVDFEYTVIDDVNEGDIIIWKNNKVTYKVNPDIRNDNKAILDCDLLLDHLYRICTIEYNNMLYQYIVHLTGPSQSDYNQTDETSADFIKNKPEINNGNLTFKVGNNEKTFSANQSDDVTFEIKPANNELGVVKTTSEVTDTTGYKPCPIVEGIPYYENINLDTASNYITIIDDTFIENLNYKNSEGEWGISTQSINFPKNKIIFYNGTYSADFYTSGDTLLGTLLPGNFYITKASDHKAYDYNEELKTVVWGECINLEYQTYGYDKLSRKYSISTEIEYTKDVIEIHNNNSEENIELLFNYPTDEMLKGKHIKIFYFNDSDVNKKLSITSTDGKCYIVGDSNITYNIESGSKCIIIDVYILDENLIINVIKNINKIS